jgi:acetylornithine aminotransferase
LILGKALSGGVYPVSAVLADDEIMMVIKPGQHGSTFGGNPIAAAVAMAALDVVNDENLIQNAAETGEYLMRNLQGISGVKEVRGRGLMIGIELEEAVGPIRDALLIKEHIFCGYAGKHTLRLLPSLAMDKALADRFLTSLQTVLSK